MGKTGGEMVSAKHLKLGDEETTKFMRKVYAAQVKHRKKKGRTYYPGVPKGQLAVVEGKHKMQKDAASALKRLLEKARSDLAEEKKKKDTHALKVKSVGINSTYRDPWVEKTAYQNAFKTWYYRYLVPKFKNLKDRHGPKGVLAMTKKMNWKKAPPGFSNHTSGTAVDFKTTERGLGTLGPSSSQSTKWKKSWLHKWLAKHDSEFGFKKLASEEWHWDYVGVKKKKEEAKK